MTDLFRRVSGSVALPKTPRADVTGWTDNGKTQHIDIHQSGKLGRDVDCGWPPPSEKQVKSRGPWKDHLLNTV